jgi:hypothetical protein
VADWRVNTLKDASSDLMGMHKEVEANQRNGFIFITLTTIIILTDMEVIPRTATLETCLNCAALAYPTNIFVNK